MPSGINPVLPSVARGDVIRGEHLDTVYSFVNRYSGMPRQGNAHVLVNAAGSFSNPLEREPYFNVYNGANSAIPAYGVALFNGAQMEASSVPLPLLKQPDTFGCQYNFAIASPSGIPSSATGLAQMVGWGPLIAAYDSADGTPSAGQCWGPRNGTWLLKKNTGGFRILGVWDSSNHWALVWPEPMTSFRGQPTADIAAGNSGTVTIYTGAYGSEASTGVTKSSIQNNSSCTVKGSQICRCVWDWDSSGSELWQFDVGKTS